MRLITRAQDEARQQALQDLISAAAEKTKMMGRMLAALRSARDYMRVHPPAPEPDRPTASEIMYPDTMAELDSLLERK